MSVLLSSQKQSTEHRDRDIAISFAGLVDARLHVVTSGEEVWAAIATQATDGRFVDERLRDVLFGLVLTGGGGCPVGASCGLAVG
jgi:hypothetical protein